MESQITISHVTAMGKCAKLCQVRWQQACDVIEMTITSVLVVGSLRKINTVQRILLASDHQLFKVKNQKMNN